MTLLKILFTALVAGATLISIIQAVFSTLSPLKKTSLMILRICTGALLLIVFIEPQFTIHHLPNHDSSIPLLVDASLSMSLFSADSIVDDIERSLASIDTGQRDDMPAIVPMLFGDSMRLAVDLKKYAPVDLNSFFPSPVDHPILRNASDIIIVSDANWSNSSPVQRTIAEKNVWYLPLPPPRIVPSIQCMIPDTVVSASGSFGKLEILCRGTASKNAPVTVTVTNGTVHLSDSFTVDAGPFSRRTMIDLPPQRPGLHIFRVLIANRTDSLETERFVLLHSVSDTIFHSLEAATPSLDVRFLRLALSQKKEFVEVTAKRQRTVDVNFIFGTDSAPAPKPLPSNLAVYLGPPPGVSGGSLFTQGASAFKLNVNETTFNPFVSLSTDGFPPVSRVFRSTNLSGIEPWITIATGKDTLPLVFRAEYRGRPVICCAFTGIWQWDFLPLTACSGEADEFIFSMTLLDAVTATVNNLHVDTLLTFPRGELSSGRPIRLDFIVPAKASSSTASPVEWKITDSSGNVVLDTSFSPESSTHLIRTMTVAPLPAGSYDIQTNHVSSSRTRQAKINFRVTEEKSELSVTAQNEPLLREIGQPLDCTRPENLSLLLSTGSRSFMEKPVARKIPVSRSWPMLIALLVLLGAEWVVRRAVRLD